MERLLHYDISGVGPVPLVLLHGFMEDRSIWQEMEADLANDFQIIKMDLPGHGLSPTFAGVHTMEEMADAVFHTLKNILPEASGVHLLGHSMGGYVALAFAERYAEALQSLTLFFSTALEDDEEKQNIRRRSIDIIEKSYSMFVNNSLPTLFSPTDRERLAPKIERAKAIALGTDKEGVKAAQLGMVTRPNRLRVLENFPRKALIISGRHDTAVKNDLFFQQLPDLPHIKRYTLDCGHNGHWEKPQICSAIIKTELLSL